MIPKILPAPSPWLILVYLLPSAIMFAGVYIRWKRTPTYPAEQQKQVQIGTLRFALLTIVMFGIVLEMIKLP